ncbi:MAG: TonB-dependent receptor [Crocinitomicaceae bacterium]
MRKLMLCLSILIIHTSFGQNTFQAILKDKATEEPLIGATAKLIGTSLGAVTNLEGVLTIDKIPDGKQLIVFSYVGYDELTDTLHFPLTSEKPYLVHLESNEELETVQVRATRSSRTIEDIPTRTEVIGGEELGEKSIMNSTNIAMILRESTGIMVQQTSANSGNQSLRIQGLDGRYTQLLKDGFPIYSGFSGGLSVMQVPPLDLQQVEVVKGSASTLYGGGAIAGLINLVTKQPEEDSPELSFMLNQTSAIGSTANLFWGQRFGKVGFTAYASGHNQIPYDPNNDGFSDIPKVQSLSINPKIFWYPSDNTTFWVGLNGAFEDRLGGDIEVIKGNQDSTHTFSEQNLSKRLSSQLHFEHKFENEWLLTGRNSINYFNRNISIPAYTFQGEQIASFSEVSFSKENEKTDWIIGTNFFTDSFKENQQSSGVSLRDYSFQTIGLFAQNNWDINEKFILESGFRTDYNSEFGFFPLPRISLLIKPHRKFSSRIGGGLGYKLPTIFNEESEILSFQGVNPIAMNSINPEKSIGANFDVNYKSLIGKKLTFSVNQMFFYTQLNNGLLLESDLIGNSYSFANADGPIQSMGFETNMKFTLFDFKLFLQYTYTDVALKYNNINNQKPLTPKHNAGAILMYEVEEKWRIGYEVYYIGEQFRSDYSQTRDYWMMGLMIGREFKHISLFINFENFTDARQSRYQTMVTPPTSNPTFSEIWAPTDGFVFNGGIVIKLFAEEEEGDEDE